MSHRHAILDDNERLIAGKIAVLTQSLPVLLAARACAAMLIGSAAEGRARDESDLDVLVVLREGAPTRADYAWWDRVVKPGLGDSDRRPFPVEPLIVGRKALRTAEPHLRGAISRGIPLWDPEGLFHDQPEARG